MWPVFQAAVRAAGNDQPAVLELQFINHTPEEQHTCYVYYNMVRGLDVEPVLGSQGDSFFCVLVGDFWGVRMVENAHHFLVFQASSPSMIRS